MILATVSYIEQVSVFGQTTNDVYAFHFVELH